MHSIRYRALALTSAIVLLTLSLGVGVAAADGGRASRHAENTFTKWVAGFPNMSGVVGGDVGTGTYSGTILSLVDTPTSRTINAVYRFRGADYSFDALVHVVANGRVAGSTAVVTGVVTDGWLAGNVVSGGYTQISCTQAASGFCFQGWLDILRGTKSADHPVGNSFTKWITTYPDMAGVVGGAVADGTYAGRVLSLAVSDTGMTINATYHFEGADHAFTALVHVVQTGLTTGATARIDGLIFDGWHAGQRVAGEYTAVACSQSSGGCFAGTLDIFRGSIWD
jgi:hypothetical protein